VSASRSGGGAFQLANRFDAVGSTSEANTLYKEGTGYAALTPFSIDYAFLRDECGKGGAVNLLGPCTISTPKDTDDNAADFYFVDTNGTSAGAGQRLGAPGPQNLASPIQRNATIAVSSAEACGRVGIGSPSDARGIVERSVTRYLPLTVNSGPRAVARPRHCLHRNGVNEQSRPRRKRNGTQASAWLA